MTTKIGKVDQPSTFCRLTPLPVRGSTPEFVTIPGRTAGELQIGETIDFADATPLSKGELYDSVSPEELENSLEAKATIRLIRSHEELYRHSHSDVRAKFGGWFFSVQGGHRESSTHTFSRDEIMLLVDVFAESPARKLVGEPKKSVLSQLARAGENFEAARAFREAFGTHVVTKARRGSQMIAIVTLKFENSATAREIASDLAGGGGVFGWSGSLSVRVGSSHRDSFSKATVTLDTDILGELDQGLTSLAPALKAIDTTSGGTDMILGRVVAALEEQMKMVKPTPIAFTARAIPLVLWPGNGYGYLAGLGDVPAMQRRAADGMALLKAYETAQVRCNTFTIPLLPPAPSDRDDGLAEEFRAGCTTTNDAELPLATKRTNAQAAADTEFALHHLDFFDGTFVISVPYGSACSDENTARELRRVAEKIAANHGSDLGNPFVRWWQWFAVDGREMGGAFPPVGWDRYFWRNNDLFLPPDVAARSTALKRVGFDEHSFAFLMANDLHYANAFRDPSTDFLQVAPMRSREECVVLNDDGTSTIGSCKAAVHTARAGWPTASEGPRVTGKMLAPKPLRILKEILQEAGEPSARVTSGPRTVEEQAELMRRLVNTEGLENAFELYGAAGDKVLEHCRGEYQTTRVCSEKQRPNMVAELETQLKILDGSGSTSERVELAHVSDRFYAFDVDPASIQNADAFTNAIRTHAEVAAYFLPPKDPAYHISVAR